MIKKTQKKEENVIKPIDNIKSHTPSKAPNTRIPKTKLLNSSCSSISSNFRDLSAEPVRMSVKLEDIIRNSASPTKANLKPELIEPEIESSIPCIEYEPKLSSRVSSGGKLLNLAKKPKEIKRVFAKVSEFCLEKMNDDCGKFEKRLMGDSKNVEDAEKFIEGVFGCKVKLKLDRNPKEIPSKVLLKGAKGFEVFDIVKY